MEKRVALSIMLLLFLASCSKPLQQDMVVYKGTTAQEMDAFKGVSAGGSPFPFRVRLPENGSSFPDNFAPAEFEWQVSGNSLWLIRMDFPDKRTLDVLTREPGWTPTREQWDYIRQNSDGGFVHMAVWGSDNKTLSRSQEIIFRVSKSSADQYLVYRVANMTKGFFQSPVTYYRDISQPEAVEFFKSEVCTGCHVFTRDSSEAIISTRKENGTLAGEDIVTSDESGEGYLEIKDQSGSIDNRGSMMSSWVPGNRKVLLNIVRTEEKNESYIVNITRKLPFETDLYESVRGDIAVYDLDKDELYMLPGASRPLLKEFWPDISPDGKTVSFGVHTVRADYPRYNAEADIYTVPFNDGKGGMATPLPGASEPGIREYFQRYSPDGRWIIFNRVEGLGDVFLENSSLYIMPAGGGTARMLECNSDAMDSLVTWSSDSRWIAFSSRRYNGESRLYMAELDEDGHCSPAVKLPGQEVGTMLAYHQAQFVKDKRAFLLIKKNYDRFLNKIG